MGGKPRTSANMLKAKRARPIKKKRVRRKKNHIPFRGVAVFMLVVLISGVSVMGFISGASAGRITSGVTAGPIIIGGLTPAEATDEITRRLTNYRLKFKTDGLEANFNPITTLDENEQALVEIDLDEVVRQAYDIGRQGGIKAAAERAGAYLLGKDVGLPFQVNRKSLEKELHVRFAGVFSPAVNAQVNVSVDNTGKTNVEIIPERPGTNLNTAKAVIVAESRLEKLSEDLVVINVRYDQPKVPLAEAEKAAEDVNRVLTRSPLTLKAKKTVWTVSRGLLANWLDVVPQEEGEAKLGFNPAVLNKYLESKAPSFAITPVDAIFEMEEGKITRLEPSVNGEKLDIKHSIAALEDAVFGIEGSKQVELPIIKVEPEITTIKSNPYGIKEIIGVGVSNFRGSPKNRRINIAIGAATLNGMVIPPDTEFSLMKALGEIDGEHGYTQELVIKKNETVPEYGGGLCQIGTTTFRAVMASALPVTERRNHSYRVPYYERDGDGLYIGPGKDATIYNPWPDLKFKNDTGNAIIIMTDITGNKLAFTFWGASDGRTAEESEVQVWDIVAPPEKQMIPSEDLPPGEVKCTESPHSGAKAAFHYTITYADGTEDSQRFYSHYRPWGEVCLIGIDPDAPPLPEDLGSGTGISADASGAQGE